MKTGWLSTSYLLIVVGCAWQASTEMATPHTIAASAAAGALDASAITGIGPICSSAKNENVDRPLGYEVWPKGSANSTVFELPDSDVQAVIDLSPGAAKRRDQ